MKELIPLLIVFAVVLLGFKIVGCAGGRSSNGYKPVKEAPLPDNWATPSEPGVIKVKKYPVVRTAWVRQGDERNSMFRTLFNHIKTKDIPMTAPVIMEYSQNVSESSEPKAMAFVYRNESLGPTGKFDKVNVIDHQEVEVVSIGLKGSYKQERFKDAAGKLSKWLDNNPDYKQSGPVRVLAYNSPFMPFWMKYSEVQIPIEKTSKTAEVQSMKPLTDFEKYVILEKGTERPFSGKYMEHFEDGVYVCRQCGTALYKSESKFKSSCGWPAFDDEIPGAVKRQADVDGRRVEIICAKCDAHLGHVFEGERLTEKNVRHCVNSTSLEFIANPATEKAYFAGGCFWGVEHYFDLKYGVISAISGYSGGDVSKPTYKQVCTGTTGHAETVEVTYNPAKISYEELAKLFFELHDPTQLNRQGPDTGTQYRSAVFYTTTQQKEVAEKLIAKLKTDGLDVVTEVKEFQTFWPAEEYHQNFVTQNPGRYICHEPVKRF